MTVRNVAGEGALRGDAGLGRLRAPELSLQQPPLLCRYRLAAPHQFGMSVVDWEALELTTPVTLMDNSLASCSETFRHGPTLTLMVGNRGVQHCSRDHQPRVGSECQAANPLPLVAESLSPVGREMGHSMYMLEHAHPPASQEQECLSTAMQQAGLN